MVTLTIDGHEVTVPVGTSVFEAAEQLGIEIPALCHDPKLNPVGVCRMCVVEVEGCTHAASLLHAQGARKRTEGARPTPSVVRRNRKTCSSSC